MTDAFEVRGADDFLKLSKALKHAGRTDLRKELNKGMRDAAKPLIPKIRAAAKAELPKRGGLAARVAKRPVRAATRTGADPGVKMIMPGTQPGYNEGVIRRPVFPRKVSGPLRKGQKQMRDRNTKWVTQRVGPGEWFDGTIEKNAPAIRGELEKAIERTAQRIVDEVR